MKHVMAFILCMLVADVAQATPDTCAVNDICETATIIQGVYADQPFTCIISCNTGATPETDNDWCSNFGKRTTTWFMVQTDGSATLMNIHVSSPDMDNPAISLFLANGDCANAERVYLTSSKLYCIVGSNGEAEAVGTEVDGNSIYYIAITSWGGGEGNFELCINTISEGNACVMDRNIEIVDRQADGELSGPFYPGETISICMNVNSFSGASNGCQWFQGLVPLFGNGWDPSSFNANHQPLNTTVNGNPIGVANNGLYGTATWDWFLDVDNHFDNANIQVGDIDWNGYVDMCHSLYEADCPDLGGLSGGCCGPCWGTPLGGILAPGWFAYGINGGCPNPGPPVRVDWGDGDDCGAGMGPWKFCFDLKVREYPHCVSDPTTSDLSLGFFTFADGETGSWVGSVSICPQDQMVKLTLPMVCNDGPFEIVEEVASICSGDSIQYTISYPNVAIWDWEIYPAGYVHQPVFLGPNGYQINHLVTNNTSTPQTITFRFTGQVDNSDKVVEKEMRLTVYPQIHVTAPDLKVCERDSSVTIAPMISGGTGNYHYDWIPTGATTPSITLTKPYIPQVIVHVGDEAGCVRADTIQIKTRPCHLGDTLPPTDDDNEPDHPKDPPPPKEDFSSPKEQISNRSFSSNMKVYPVPAQDAIVITWNNKSLITFEKITLVDLKGHVVMQVPIPLDIRTRIKVDVTELPAGVYYVTCFSKDNVETAKMVKL